MVCLIFLPEQAEVAEHDDEIIARQLLLLRKGFATEFVDVNRDMCITCQVNHDACPQSNISAIRLFLTIMSTFGFRQNRLAHK